MFGPSGRRAGRRAPAWIAAAVLLVPALPTGALAALTGSFVVVWDANTTDPDLAGYRVYLSTDSGVFSLPPAQARTIATVTTVGPGTTQATLSSLDPTRVYWVGVTSFDESGNESGFSNIESAQPRDVTAPAVSLTAPSSGATVQGTITVSASATDDVGVAGVRFRVDGNDIGAEDTASPWSISWSTLTVPNGSHTLSAVARDAAGNATTSASRTITVNNPDTVPPTVSLTAPANGATVAGQVAVSATAADNLGVAGVQFKLDGSNLGAEDTSAPYSITWNSTATPNGSHTITAVARDAGGNRTTSAAAGVTLSNPDTTSPTVAITAPSGGSVLSGVVIISASATDLNGVVGVQFRVDGTDVGNEDTTAPYAITWGSTTFGNGAHTLTAVARDAAGNSGVSAAVNVTVSNTDTTPPTVSLITPTAGSVLGGTATLTALASDNVGVIGLQFQLDGSNVGTLLLAPPWTIPWDTTLVPDGSHTLTATARDAAGNTTTSAGVVIEVSNPTPSTCATGTDPDGDGVCGLSDNCANVYNPSQANTDGDLEGGDACDITVIYPLNGDLTCADPPPTITWTPETYSLYKVWIGATVSFSVQVNSGKKVLTTTSWTMPEKKWKTICGKARPFLFVKVKGSNPNSKWFEYSEVSTVIAK